MAAAPLGAPLTGHAQPHASAGSFPSRPLRLIVPFAPGGGTDLSARIIMNRVGQTIGQQVVVENRGGAGGDIAMLAAAAAPADGYTLFYGNEGSNARGVAMRDQMPLDPLRAFTTVARLVFAWSAFVVHQSIPVRSMDEFIAYARERPGQLNYGSSGQGTLAHVASSLFAHTRGLDVVHVPYRGAALAAQDLAAGRLQFSFLTAGGLLPSMSGPTVRVLAVSGPKRSANFPAAQTMAEAGITELDISTWYGVFAPAGTPAPVVDLLARHMGSAVAEPELVTQLEEQSLIPGFLPPEPFGTYLTAQVERWREISARTGIRF
jgi:tripartite-type tricarboxylate transporter receptor subunit TctC